MMRTTSRWIPTGSCRWTPNQVANMAPKISCPWPPMLNRPERKDRAMPREMMISGVATVRDSISG